MSQSGYDTLDEAVKSYLDMSEQGMSKYLKCWNIGYGILSDLGLDFFSRVKTVKLPVNANKTVNFPSDYISYIKIGLLNAKGELVPMKHNPNLTNFGDLFPDRAAKTEDNKLYDAYMWGTPVFYNYWYGNYYGNYYGIPSGGYNIGSFKIDEQNGVILLGEWFNYDYLMVEYISNPEEGSAVNFPSVFRSTVEWGIAWKDVAMMPTTRRGGLGDKADRRRNFFNERRLANARYRPLSLDEAYQWSIENQRMVVKA